MAAKKQKRGRYEHHFDWEEAKRLYDEGIPQVWIAAKFRVSPAAVYRVVKPGVRERQDQRRREKSVGKGVCERCGAPTNKLAQRNGARYCVSCAGELRITSVREDTLWCFACKQWKPDEEFFPAKTRAHRRYRSTLCRVCDNAGRRKRRRQARTSCKGGCGKLISLSSQRNELRRGRANYPLRLVGYCPSCRRTRLTAEDKREIKAAKFRKKFGQASATTGTTEN